MSASPYHHAHECWKQRFIEQISQRYPNIGHVALTELFEEYVNLQKFMASPTNPAVRDNRKEAYALSKKLAPSGFLHEACLSVLMNYALDMHQYRLKW